MKFLRPLLFLVVGFIIMILLLLNLTPGHFQQDGCCSDHIAYVTDQQAQLDAANCGSLVCSGAPPGPLQTLLLYSSIIDYDK